MSQINPNIKDDFCRLWYCHVWWGHPVQLELSISSYIEKQYTLEYKAACTIHKDIQLNALCDQSWTLYMCFWKLIIFVCDLVFSIKVTCPISGVKISGKFIRI